MHSKRFFVSLAILWIISLAAVLFLWLQGNGLSTRMRQQFPVAAQAAQPSGHGPYSYSVPMGFERLSQTETFTSPAVLQEDGRALGPGNTLHADIGAQGGGRFSFWKGSLIFSSSDNSDPRTNGRQYLLLLPVSLSPGGMVIAYTWVVFLTLCFLVMVWQTLPPVRRGLVYIGLGMGVMVIVGASIKFIYPQIKAAYTLFRTQIYILSFDPAYYERQGSDYCNPRFNPERIGKVRDKIVEGKEYDFIRLVKTRAYLWGVDRRTALKQIFDTVTRGAQTDTEKHLALLLFLQKASYHNYFPPIDPQGNSVHDPLVYLELGEMWCADIAELAVDIFAAAGYEGRIVQLGGHQIAEIFFDDDWHYFDADLFSGGDVLLMPDGTIPSVDELSRYENRSLLDSLPTYREHLIVQTCFQPRLPTSAYQATYHYFSSLAYIDVKPLYYIKTATAGQERQDEEYYGWFIRDVIPDPERGITPFEMQYTPGVVFIDSIMQDPANQKVNLSFHSSDKDGDLVGYRIFISERSRGWDYSAFFGADEVKKYWSITSGWEPEMYEAFHQLPPSDVDLIITSTQQAELFLQLGKTYYITVMPFDAYGEKVGLKLYPASNEIKITLQ